MEIQFSLPTRIIMGEGCIRKNAGLLEALGKKAFIVTSRSSAVNGSLEDVTAALTEKNIAYKVFDNTSQNPSVQAVWEMGEIARAWGCDFIIGIGGGSAMDAAKAVAVFAVNEMAPEMIYASEYPVKPCPIVAVPTTCGTGSEVTPFSVLTFGENKKSFTSEFIYPRIAFLDAAYIFELPQHITVETALDALAHAAEGYLMVDSWMSDMLAERVFAFFACCIPGLKSGRYTHEMRERLLFIATIGGLAINITRTSAAHAMGYALTTQRGIPHGRACGLLLGAYVDFCYPAKKAKTDTMLALLGLKNTDELAKLLSELLVRTEKFTREELAAFTELTYQAAISRANPRKMEKKDVLAVFEQSLLG